MCDVSGERMVQFGYMSKPGVDEVCSGSGKTRDVNGLTNVKIARDHSQQHACGLLP